MSRKEIREILRYLERLGWVIRQGGKHYVATKPGQEPITIPKTPGDVRSLKNTYGQLRRHGIPWPPEGKKPSGRKH